MTMYPPHVKRCDRGHPIDSPRCVMCEQQDKEQAQADLRTLEALRRLAKAGQLGPFLREVLTEH